MIIKHVDCQPNSKDYKSQLLTECNPIQNVMQALEVFYKTRILYRVWSL